MRPLEVRTEALRLVAAGVNDCEISRRVGVPRSTIRDWRKPRYVPKRPTGSRCPRCGQRSRPIVFAPADYAELLGLYLGDGHIARLARTQRLRLCLDSRYEYLSYDFRNLSGDILDLFVEVCLSLRLRPRRYAERVRLNRREDVARLVEHVGIKS